MSALTPGEPLAIVAIGPWRMLLPLRFIERVLQAAMPVALPSGDGEAAAMVRLENALVPVVFGAGLLGAEDVALSTEAKMVLLKGEAGRAIFWVDAVEDVVPYQPFEGEVPLPGFIRDWVQGFSEGYPALAVVNAEALIRASLAPGVHA